MDTSTLLSRIDAYCEAHGVSATAFGLKAINDGKLVPRLRVGKTITLKTYQRIDTLLKGSRPRRAKVAVEARP